MLSGYHGLRASGAAFYLTHVTRLATVWLSTNSRFFLELCSGEVPSLSLAISQHWPTALPLDSSPQWGGSRHDILQNDVYFTLVLLVVHMHIWGLRAAPPCGLHSKLRLRRPGPKVLRTPSHLDGVSGLNSRDYELLSQSRNIHERVSQLLILAVEHQCISTWETPADSRLFWSPAMFRCCNDCHMRLILLPAQCTTRTIQLNLGPKFGPFIAILRTSPLCTCLANTLHVTDPLQV